MAIVRQGVDAMRRYYAAPVQRDWQALKDESTGDHYWWNTVTNETTWDKPPGAPALV